MENLALDGREADQGDGVDGVVGLESADAGEDTEPLTLAQKIVAIRKQCAGIGKEPVTMKYQKDGKWVETTYPAHTIEGVLVAVRHLLNEHNVIITPSVVERVYNGNRCDVIIEFTWECVESGETRVVRWAGADTDKGGKGFAKAGTNALKEHLKKFLLITDRDDAKEETENLEHQTAEQVSRSEVEAAKEKARQQFENLAKAWIANIKNAPDVAALKMLKREQTFLDDPDLPGTTKQFLDKLYSERIAELEAGE